MEDQLQVARQSSPETADDDKSTKQKETSPQTNGKRNFTDSTQSILGKPSEVDKLNILPFDQDIVRRESKDEVDHQSVRLEARVLKQNNEGARILDRPIDIFVAKDLREESAEHVTVAIIKSEGKTFFGVQGQNTENNTFEGKDAEIVPVTTFSQLEQILAMIESFTGEHQRENKELFPEMNIEVGNSVTVFEKNNDTDPVEKNEAQEFVVIVSGDMLDAIEGVKELLGTSEEIEPIFHDKNNQEKPSAKRYITISSGERQIVIEQTALQKIVEIHNVRRQIVKTIMLYENVTAFEELGLHTMYPSQQAICDVTSLLLAYHIMLLLFYTLNITQAEASFPKADVAQRNHLFSRSLVV